MSVFGTLLKYELKKLFVNRAAIISLAASIGLLFGITMMKYRRIIHITMPAAGLIWTIAFLDMFTSLLPKIRILSQIRYLTPLQVLNNSSMADPRLLKMGNIFLTSFQTAAVMYVSKKMHGLLVSRYKVHVNITKKRTVSLNSIKRGKTRNFLVHVRRLAVIRGSRP